MRNITINFEALIRLLIIAGLMIMFLYLWASGRVLNFVHPRMTVFVLAAGVVFTILLILQFPSVTGWRIAEGGWWRRLSYLFFLLPLVFGFVYSDRSLSADFAGRQGGVISAPAGRPGAGGNYEVPGQTGEKLIFEETTYAIQLMLIYENMDEYLGREVELTGFVYRDESFPDGYFAVARYIITCCAADAQVVGMLFRSDTPVNEGDWIRVTGTIEKGQRDGAVVLVIDTRRIEATEPPENQYIYF